MSRQALTGVNNSPSESGDGECIGGSDLDDLHIELNDFQMSIKLSLFNPAQFTVTASPALLSKSTISKSNSIIEVPKTPGLLDSITGSSLGFIIDNLIHLDDGVAAHITEGLATGMVESAASMGLTQHEASTLEKLGLATKVAMPGSKLDGLMSSMSPSEESSAAAMIRSKIYGINQSEDENAPDLEKDGFKKTGTGDDGTTRYSRTDDSGTGKEERMYQKTETGESGEKTTVTWGIQYNQNEDGSETKIRVKIITKDGEVQPGTYIHQETTHKDGGKSSTIEYPQGRTNPNPLDSSGESLGYEINDPNLGIQKYDWLVNFDPTMDGSQHEESGSYTGPSLENWFDSLGGTSTGTPEYLAGIDGHFAQLLLAFDASMNGTSTGNDVPIV